MIWRLHIALKRVFQVIVWAVVFAQHGFDGRDDPRTIEIPLTVETIPRERFVDKALDWPLCWECLAEFQVCFAEAMSLDEAQVSRLRLVGMPNFCGVVTADHVDKARMHCFAFVTIHHAFVIELISTLC